MNTKKVKAIELVFDWNLWPRQSAQKLDITNVKRMMSSLQAGFSLPPIVISQDYRIVDGFHRTKAMLSVFGDEAEIDAEIKSYDNDAAMFLEAGALNSFQGLTMSPKDRAHFIIKCRKMKIPPAAIAQALHMDEKRMKEFVAKRSAKTQSGETIPLSAGARNLAGLELTEVQEHYARTANGCLPEMYAAMLLNALRANAIILSERTIAKLTELRNELDSILEGV
jgi:ParB-like chromosome segregation protein Spo0J